MKNERKTPSTPTAAALTESNLDTIAREDDATAPVPNTSPRKSYRSEIVASSGRIKRIDPATNVVVSLGERATEQGLELKVYHRVDDRVGSYFTAIIGEGNGYGKAGRYFASQLGSGIHDYTIVSDVPIAPEGEVEYQPLAKDKIDVFKRALDERLSRR